MREARSDLLGGARALLHLIGFDEPFGFSVVEAMACGTPVITYRRGSMPEIVRDGENGFLVESIDQAVAAVRGAADLDRRAVRASVERRFDSDRMVDDYLAAYQRVAELHRTRGTDVVSPPVGTRASASASTTGRLARRWAGGLISTGRRSRPTSPGSPPPASTRSGSS